MLLAVVSNTSANYVRRQPGRNRAQTRRASEIVFDELSKREMSYPSNTEGRKANAMKCPKHLGLYCLLLTFWMSAAFARPFEDVQAPPCPMHQAKDQGTRGQALNMPDCCKQLDHLCSGGSRFSACADGVDCHGGVAPVILVTGSIVPFLVRVRSLYPPHAEHGPPPGTIAPRWRPPAVA